MWFGWWRSPDGNGRNGGGGGIGWIIVAVMVILLMSGGFWNLFSFWPLLALGGLFFSIMRSIRANSRSRNRANYEQFEDRYEDYVQGTPVRAVQDAPIQTAQPLNERAPLNIARDAVRAAGNVPNDDGVMLRDIGLMVYNDAKDQPSIYRDQTIPADAEYIRPFMVVRIPYAQGATGTVRLELLDAAGQVRFANEERYILKSGNNAVVAGTWLRMGDENPGGGWFLRATIGGTVLAQHRFYIEPDAAAGHVRNVGDDGEMAVPLETASGRLSLDELIGDQQEDLTAEQFFNQGKTER